MLTVGASNAEDQRNNSNFSATLVDVFAPGDSSSSAAPMVSSVAALLRALNSEAGYTEITEAIIGGADFVPELEGLCVANGRLNARGAVESLLGISLLGQEQPFAPPAPTIAVDEITDTSVALFWSSPETEVDAFELQVSIAGKSFVPLEPGSLFPGDATEVLVEGLSPATEYQFRLRAFIEGTPSAWTTTSRIHLPKAVPDINGPVHAWRFDSLNGDFVPDMGECPSDIDLEGFSLEEGVTGNGVLMAGNHNGFPVTLCPSLSKQAIRQFTIAFWIKIDSSNQRLVTPLFEMGDYWRGLNILLERGWLTANGWNRPARESDWAGTTINGGYIRTNEWNHVALVVDASEVISADSLHLYLNGELKGSGPASMLWNIGDHLGFGQVQDSTTYRNQYAPFLNPYQGIIDDIFVWNRTLTESEIEELVLSLE
jgi:hypothetical protein